MPSQQRNPFEEDPQPSFVEVTSVDFDVIWDGEGDDKVVCPADQNECKGRFAERGTSDGKNWVSFAPCGHVVVLAEWDVF
jgi:hypothetical protein